MLTQYVEAFELAAKFRERYNLPIAKTENDRIDGTMILHDFLHEFTGLTASFEDENTLSRIYQNLLCPNVYPQVSNIADPIRARWKILYSVAAFEAFSELANS